MKRILEFLEQQDGALCALQLSIVAGFSIFWIAWMIVSFKNHTLSDCPTGLAALLSAMLAAKVWKDITDFKNQPPPTS
jgi:hypothetical protein